MQKDTLIEYTKSESMEIDENLPLCVHNAGHYIITLCEWSTSRPYGRDDYQLIYLHEGHMRITLGNKTLVIGSGSVVIYKPHQPQLYTYMNDIPCEAYWIHFYGTIIPEMLRKLSLEGSSLFNIGTNYQIQQFFNEILINLIGNRFGGFYSNCGRALMIFSEVAVNSRAQTTHATSKRFDEILLQMHDVMSSTSIKDIATMNNLSVSRFSHLFTQNYGISPHSYRIKLKIERAKHLLSEHGHSIKEIANMLGFEDPLYFSRIFKKYTGVSPKDFKHKSD